MTVMDCPKCGGRIDVVKVDASTACDAWTPDALARELGEPFWSTRVHCESVARSQVESRVASGRSAVAYRDDASWVVSYGAAPEATGDAVLAYVLGKVREARSS